MLTGSKQTTNNVNQIINSKTNSNWPNVEVKFNKSIDLYVDSLYGFQDNQHFNILWVKEVEEISSFKTIALQNHSKFDLILTYDDEILNKCSNSVMFEFGTSCVFDYDYNKEKKFSISHLTGNKSITYGHRLRKEIYDWKPYRFLRK